MMEFLSLLVSGLIVGLVARFLMPGKDPAGCILTILLGIAGAVVGGYIGQLLGLYRVGEPAGFIGSVLGAMLLLFLFRMLRQRR